METGSVKYDLSMIELKKIGKMLLRGALYSIVTGLIVVIAHLNIPTEYAFLIPIISMLLTNLSYVIKKFITDTTLPNLSNTPTI